MFSYMYWNYVIEYTCGSVYVIDIFIHKYDNITRTYAIQYEFVSCFDDWHILS